MSATSGLGQYLENAMLAWFAGSAFPAVPANLYFALFTTAPINGVDSAAVEVSASATAYARKAIAPSSALFGAASGAAPATCTNAENIVWATPSAAWGTVVGWGVYDAVTGGHLLAYGTFAGVAVASGDAVEFLSGNMTLSVS